MAWAHRMKLRGKITPHSDAIATVTTIGSAIRPRKAFGNPSRLACQVRATAVHEICALMLQDSWAYGFLAIRIASTLNTSDAVNDSRDEMSISMNDPRCRTAGTGPPGAADSGMSTVEVMIIVVPVSSSSSIGAPRNGHHADRQRPGT